MQIGHGRYRGGYQRERRPDSANRSALKLPKGIQVAVESLGDGVPVRCQEEQPKYHPQAVGQIYKDAKQPRFYTAESASCISPHPSYWNQVEMPDGHTDRIPGPHHGGNFEPPTRKRIQAHHAARPSLTRAVYTDLYIWDKDPVTRVRETRQESALTTKHHWFIPQNLVSYNVESAE
ncbi:hypothetical protein X797_003863 [Metarhizium robertsii]|uniref:Uncharacterized protein n=1 Tax=Metarhizium robertsii TaxID=568076 RepID=A0A0A1UZE7_9HYPO|nr:hypothetical protein X797_003863 [Metarhizium robertsii]